MKLYRIRIHPERSPGVQRVFEFAARHTLLEVHDAIHTAFELDGDPLHAFYLSGQHWDVATEISSGAIPGEVGRTGRVRLHELRLEPRQRFAYVFDFDDEHWFSLEVEALEDADEPPLEPRLLESVGAARPQPGDTTSVPPELEALVAQANDFIALFPRADADDALDADDEGVHALEDAGDSEDLDDSEDELTSAYDLSHEDLASAHALARQLALELDADGVRFAMLERACNTDLLSLLADLPDALAKAEKVDDGAELARLLAFLDPPHFLGERALLLAEAGRREDALAQLAENLEAADDDAWVEVKAADVHAVLGDSERAEGLLRAVLSRQVEAQARDGALDRLLELLESQGRTAECKALLAAERQRLDASIQLNTQTEQRLAPKVGRNDPCPCGSGKKHKKCCLA